MKPDENLVTCFACNRELGKDEAVYDSNNLPLCETCQPEWSPCKLCESWANESYEGVGFVCSSCKGQIYRCSWCDNYTYDDDAHGDGNSNYICDSCYCNEVGLCEVCSSWTNEENPNGDWMCSTCHEDSVENGLHSYDYQPTLNFLPQPQSDTLYLGVELETDKYAWPAMVQACEDLNELGKRESLFYLKEDGSLTCGIEIVTQPATLEYHRTQFPWQAIIDIVHKHKGLSHETDTCGIHVHFNKDFFGQTTDEVDANALKLLYLIERFWEQLVVFSRRTPESLDSWANRYLQIFKDMPLKEYQEIKYQRGKYMAVNLNSDFTFEVRIFRGTTKLDTLLACLELVDFLARLVKNLTAQQLYAMTWAGLVRKVSKKKYPNLNEYLISKALKGKGVKQIPECKENGKIKDNNNHYPIYEDCNCSACTERRNNVPTNS